jgi:hypothetical protein
MAYRPTKAELESIGDENTYLFQTISNWKCITHVFSSTEFATSFI